MLAAFSSSEPVVSLTRLAELSGLPVATTHRLVGELTSWGALERLPDGRLQIGKRLWSVGALAPRVRDLRSVALPYMEDLYEATHENVQLVVRDGDHAVALDTISGGRSVDFTTVVAGRLPLHATGVGKIILAFSEPALLAKTVSGGLEARTPFTITLPGVLAEALREIRRTRVAYSVEEMTLGTASVAAPIFARDGLLRASISVVVRSSTSLRPLVPAVRTAALGAARALTASSEQPIPPGGRLS